MSTSHSDLTSIITNFLIISDFERLSQSEQGRKAASDFIANIAAT